MKMALAFHVSLVMDLLYSDSSLVLHNPNSLLVLYGIRFVQSPFTDAPNAGSEELNLELFNPAIPPYFNFIC